MATEIHPTAIVDPKAELGARVRVGPFSVIGPDVRIGDECEILNHVTLAGHTRLGARCAVFPGAVLGLRPQDLKYKGGHTLLEVGQDTTIREYVTIHPGTELGGGRTVVGAHNFLMAYVHVAHDCILENRVIISNSTQLAGHVLIQEGARVSGMVAIHHFVRIGRLSFVAGMARLTSDVPPFTIAEGHPARIRGLNEEGLKRRGFTEERLDRLKKTFRLLFRGDLVREKAFEEIASAGLGEDAEVKEMVDFIRAMDQGRHGRAREGQRASVPPEARDGQLSYSV